MDLVEHTDINSEIKPSYKKQTWDEYVRSKEEEFEEIRERDDFSSCIKISNIPNDEEFNDLIDKLKEDGGSRLVEFAITECGYGRFYLIYKNSGLYDIVKTIKSINNIFYFGNFRQYRIRICDSILDNNRSNKFFVLRMSKGQRAMIERLLKDIRVDARNFGLMMCIFSFHRARYKFRHTFLTGIHENFYEDDGYVSLIEKEIDIAVEDGIRWLIDSIPMIFEDIQKDMRIYLFDPESISPIFKQKLFYKTRTTEEILGNIHEKIKERDMKLPLIKDLYISSLKEDIGSIPINV